MMSIWWILVAFIAGGYAGAILVGLMSMAARNEERRPATVRTLYNTRGEAPRRRRHATPVSAH
jgi:hypothetical protein